MWKINILTVNFNFIRKIFQALLQSISNGRSLAAYVTDEEIYIFIIFIIYHYVNETQLSTISLVKLDHHAGFKLGL